MTKIYNNFWSACPKNLEYFPQDPCSLGKKGSDSCIWFINSEEDSFCFWAWVRRNSNESGGFDPLTQQEIAKLLNLTSVKIQNIFRETLLEIENSNEFDKLKELFSL